MFGAGYGALSRQKIVDKDRSSPDQRLRRAELANIRQVEFANIAKDVPTYGLRKTPWVLIGTMEPVDA